MHRFIDLFIIYKSGIKFCSTQASKVFRNPGKVHFEVFIYLLRYIRENDIWGLKYYSDMNDAPVTELLRQASIKTENLLMTFSDSSRQDCPYTGKSTGACIIVYQGGKIDHGSHIP